MDRIKRFIDCYIPTETCNLRCHYCYIAQKRKFNNQLVKFSHTPQEIAEALSVKRLGGICLLNLCAGGETLLSGEVLPVVKTLIQEGHYVMIVSNGTITTRFQEISKWEESLKEKLFIKFSFHYLEFKRLGILGQFFSNVQLMKDAGVSFTVEITPSDELIPFIDEIKQVCMDNLKTLCHITIARDDRTNSIEVLSDLSFEEYRKVWGEFSSDLFEFKSRIFYQKRKEFCYAGDWSAYLNLETGLLSQCYCGKILGNVYDDVDKPIPFEAIGCKCSLAHCYNGHAFLALGDIPELKTPTYAALRNRQCSDGTEWLAPLMKSFMSTKLCESNEEYSNSKKTKIAIKEHWNDFRQGIHKIKVRLLKKK